MVFKHSKQNSIRKQAQSNLIFFLNFVPKKLLSFIIGHFFQIKWPKFFVSFCKNVFVKKYKICMDEATLPLENYKSVGELFTRQIKTKSRPLAKKEEGLIHPVDGILSQFGPIRSGNLIQAKGMTYSLNELLNGKSTLKHQKQVESESEKNHISLEKAYLKDGFFFTYYLSPSNCHRIYSPESGSVFRCKSLRGNLWPVNESGVLSIPKLFVTNERIAISLKTSRGFMTLVLVGALNVGKISLSFNKKKVSKTHPYFISRGEELGIFHLGSSVILILEQKLLNPKPHFLLKPLQTYNVRFGESLFST